MAHIFAERLTLGPRRLSLTSVGEDTGAILDTEEIVLKSVLKSEGEGSIPSPCKFGAGLTPKSCSGISEAKRGVEKAEGIERSSWKEPLSGFSSMTVVRRRPFVFGTPSFKISWGGDCGGEVLITEFCRAGRENGRGKERRDGGCCRKLKSGGGLRVKPWVGRIVAGFVDELVEAGCMEAPGGEPGSLGVGCVVV